MPYHTPTHRHLCSELVSMLCTKDRHSHKLSGNLEEIGEWSALVLAETPITRRTKVRIACDGHELKGFVRSCRQDKSLGFLVDVRLYPESRWSQQWFTPKHLLALYRNL